MGKLADLVARDFGGPVASLINREVSSVATSVTRIFRLDADRLGATIVNLSATKVYVGPFNNPSITKGYLLGPNGGQLVLRWDDDFLSVGAEWFGISIKTAAAIYTEELIAQATPTPPSTT